MYGFLENGSETGALISARDWSDTPLGPIDEWSVELRSTVAMMLRSPVPIATMWYADGILLYNDAYSIVAGSRHPRLLGTPVREGWAEVADFNNNVMSVVMAGNTLSYLDQELTLYRNGQPEQVWLNLDYSPVLDADNNPFGVFCILRETSERVATARQHATERDRLRRMLQQMPGFAAMLRGPDHRYEFVNDAYVKISGTREFVGRTVREVFPELVGQGFYELLDEVISTGERFSARAMPIQLTGEAKLRYIDLLYQPVRGEHGEIGGIFVGGYDVTEHVRNELYRDALVALTGRISAATDPDDMAFDVAEIIGEALKVSRVGYGTIDPIAETLHVVRDWNAPGTETLAGVVPLRDYGSFIESLKRDEFISIEDVTLDPRTALAADALIARSAGSFVNVPVVEQGELVAVLYVNHAEARAWTREEHTFVKEAAERTRVAIERLRNVRALRELNATLEQRIDERSAALRLHENIIQSDVTAICAFDLNYRLIAFNQAHNDEFKRVNGFETRLGDVFPDLFVPEQRPVMRAQMARALAGESFTVEEEFGKPEIDAPRWEIHYSPLRNADGKIIGAFHHARDVSERQRAQAELTAAQEALRQSQKMEAMGQLTGGVAHDFNNLLTPIVGTLDMLQRKQVGGEREQRLIGGALTSAERARTLVQRLLAFARRQPLQSVAVDVGRLVGGVIDLITSTIGPHIQLDVDVPPNLPLANADANQLEMALVNLAVNARDAMPDGGKLRIAVSAQEADDGPHGLSPGRYLRISVDDDGAGMSEETLARAVEPFFSTKGVGKGTGLGLSMVHGLASQLGGDLEIDSGPSKGTSIRLWLPESDAQPAEPTAVRDMHLPDRRGIALLVDDEEAVRLSTSEMLRELGYEVLEAGTAEAALALISGGILPDVVVTDHLMPGMNGSDLAREIRRSAPLPVLIISGYAESEGISPDLPRLVKPFRRDELIASLAALTG